jgi:hypothetical protein
MAADLAEVHAAWEWAAAHGRPDLLARIRAGAMRFCALRGAQSDSPGEAFVRRVGVCPRAVGAAPAGGETASWPAGTNRRTAVGRVVVDHRGRRWYG